MRTIVAPHVAVLTIAPEPNDVGFALFITYVFGGLLDGTIFKTLTREEALAAHVYLVGWCREAVEVEKETPC